jgi:glycosyltransferase involved in cell wall biosynthesis/SAM-dependent methyltransferase
VHSTRGDMTLYACTIVARNYLPLARVLARSFLEHNPGSRFATLVIDDREHALGEDEPFEVVHLDELVPDPAELHLLATYYDVMELATAVKPLLLMHLLKHSDQPVAYLDPDIQVYAPLDPVEKGVQQEPIALTPHTLAPYPRDGLRPTEAEILGAGVYNLGFIAVSHGCEEFLRWWWERLQRDAVVDPARMLFTDQRWIDFVPGLFPHVLLKDPGLNVAYWNLHGRTVERGPDGYLVNGQPLRFFHYSGYSPFARDVLSKHTGDHPRVRLSDSPVVAELAHAYGERLVGEGLVKGGGAAYGWGAADDGTRIDAPARRAYREAVLRAEAGGTALGLPPDPFSAGGGAALLAWLGSPDSSWRWKRVSRYLQAVYDMRPDLQAAFPVSAKDGEHRYLDWAKDGVLGTDRTEVELSVLTGAARVAAAPAPVLTDAGLPAVQAVGYFKAELGMGEYGRQLVAAVQATGAPVSTTTWTDTISRQEHEFEDQQGAGAAAVNLLVVNADQTPVFAAAAGPDFFAGRYTVGAWAWEVEDFPEAYDPAFDVVDEIWAISSFTRDAVARRTGKPVFAVPPPVTVPVVDPTITRADLGLPEGFLFLFSYDFLSIPKRKNAQGVVDAFTSAFAPGEGPTLVIKSINGDKQRAAREELRRQVTARPDVLLLEDYLTPAQRTALMGHADCYVSLHRSEGLGLTMAESMALGKPVIATAYSGNMEFMDEENSYLVPYDRVPVGAGAEPYPATAQWAEPRIEVASELMRRVLTSPDEMRAKGERAARDIAEKHSPAARATLVHERLTDLVGRLPAPSTAPAASAPPDISLSAVQRRVRRARTILKVARTPEMRNAALRRRAGGVVSAGFGQSRRAIAEQEATRREVLALRNRVDLVARDADDAGRRVSALAAHGATAEEAAARAGAAVEALAARVDDLAGRADGADAQIQATEARMDAVVARLDEGSAVADLGQRRSDELAARLDAVSLTVEQVADELGAAPYSSDPAALQVDGLAGRTLGYTDGQGGSYADFEDLFRGTADFIRERQRAYLPVLKGAAPVLDLGCGRGEMLAVLAEAGVGATGVDLDASMVERCQAEGLPVTLGDAVTYLRAQAAGSLGAVTSFQFVEHLSLGDLEEVMRLAHAALRPGGVLVAETVNPHSPRALKAFWLDLTHRHPIFPEAALMLAKGAGFGSAEIFFPHGRGDYEHDRLTQGEYALVARR